MFDLMAKRLVWIPVRWPGLMQVDPDGPAIAVEHEIDCQVELLDKDGLDVIEEEFGGDASGFSKAEQIEREVGAFLAMCHDWKRVADGSKSVPFTPEAAKRMTRQPGFSQGFNKAYVEAMNGIAEIREKNSAGSPSDGQAAEAKSATTKSPKTSPASG